MHIASVFSYFVLICLLILAFYVVYLAGENNGKIRFKEKLFKTTLKDYKIMSLNKGFEKYYVKIERVKEEDLDFRETPFGTVAKIKENK